MSNKLDPIHAVASLSLAFIEAQKDISQMRRQLDTLFDQLRTVDQATAVKFKEVDTYIDKMSREISSLLVKEVPNAANDQGKENTSVNEENIRSEES
jgi:hypothetical protein